MYKPTSEHHRSNKHIMPGEHRSTVLTGFERFMDKVFEAANLPLGPRLSSFGAPAVEAVVQFPPETEITPKLSADDTTLRGAIRPAVE